MTEAAIPGPSVLTRLSEVHQLLWVEAGSLVAVQFCFDEGFLSVEVNPDLDAVELSFDPSETPPLRHCADTVRQRNPDEYADILGLNSAWRWVLHNQQGYRDAFQIEFGSAGAEITIQYLAISSQLSRRRICAITTW